MEGGVFSGESGSFFTWRERVSVLVCYLCFVVVDCVCVCVTSVLLWIVFVCYLGVAVVVDVVGSDDMAERAGLGTHVLFYKQR